MGISIGTVMRFVLWIGIFFNSTCYAYQCVSPEEIYTETDIVKGRSAIFFANEKRVWFYSYPNASCRQKEIFIVKGDLVYVFPYIMVFTMSSMYLRKEIQCMDGLIKKILFLISSIPSMQVKKYQ